MLSHLKGKGVEESVVAMQNGGHSKNYFVKVFSMLLGQHVTKKNWKLRQENQFYQFRDPK